MDLGNNSMTPADFAAVMGNGNNGWGNGFGDGNGWWIIILFLFAMNGGWGNNRGNGGFNNDGVGAVPYLMTESTQAAVQNGFNQQALISGINGLTSNVSNGFANAEVSRCNAQANILQTLGNNQMGLYQTLNANQNATTANMNNLAMALQNCCCENRAGLSDLKYTVATEACADRQAVNNGIRDVIANQTANTQALINNQTAGFRAIEDKLCQLELDGYKQKVSDQSTEIATLNAEITALKGAISQTAQTAALIQDNNNQTANLIRAINPAPVPAYQVPNPNTGCCGGNYYGCGCAG